jgi:hypothetical protein
MTLRFATTLDRPGVDAEEGCRPHSRRRHGRPQGSGDRSDHRALHERRGRPGRRPPIRTRRRFHTLPARTELRLATVAGAFVFGASPVWGSALLVAYVSVQGRSLVEWAPVVGNWWRKELGQHRYRTRPMKPRPAGTLALPGDMDRLRVLVDEVTGSAMVHDPYDGTLTAVLKVGHGAFVQETCDQVGISSCDHSRLPPQ